MPARGHAFAAVDLGATSGRVIVGELVGAPGQERVDLTEVARFPNEPVLLPPSRGDAPGVLTWDLLALWRGILAGLREAVARFGPLAGVAIDSWAVDYGIVDDDGRLLAAPVCYRDERTAAVMARAFDLVPAPEQYAANGLQVQPFTTAFQLLADPVFARLTSSSSANENDDGAGDGDGRGHDDGVGGAGDGARILLLPDLLGAWLTGTERAEITNASTTGLLDAATRDWSSDLLARFGISPALLPQLAAPGELLGPIRPAIATQLALAPGQEIPVRTVGSHDTASAVVAVPLSTPRSAYISCGTWSLVGLELDEPVLTEASRAANVTNEAGVDGTVRYLKNVMGLWVLSETLRWWESAGTPIDLADALAQARAAAQLRTVVDIDNPVLLPPGNMPGRLAELARATGQPVPESPGEVVRCILDSLALAYRRSVRQVAQLAGREVDVVHVVGGGIHNADLMQLSADALGLPVVCGPAEGAALGNVLIQARAAGHLRGSLADLRRVVERSTTLVTVTPRAHPGQEAWDDADRRARGLAVASNHRTEGAS